MPTMPRNHFSIFAIGCALAVTGCQSPLSNEGQKSFSFRQEPDSSVNTSTGIVTFNDSRSWRTAVQIDPYYVTDPEFGEDPFTGGVDVSTGFNTFYLPPAVGHDYDGRLYVAMTAQSNFDSNRYTAVVSVPTTYSTDSWATTTSFSTFTELGGGIASSGATPNGTFGFWFLSDDSTGDLHGFLGRIGSTGATDEQLYHAWHPRESDAAGSWSDGIVPTRVSPPVASVVTVGGADDQSCPPRAAVNASGQVIMVHCAYDAGVNYTAYTNFYDPDLGWSGSGVLASSVGFLGTTYNVFTGAGVDIDLDSSGDGWAVMQLRSSAIGNAGDSLLFLTRYEDGVGFTGQNHVIDRISGGVANDQFISPRLWVRSDGSGSVFYVRYDAGTTLYSLWRADFSASGFLSSAPTQVDGDDTSLSLSLFASTGGVVGLFYKLPQLVTSGDYAALAFSKPSVTGGNDRVWMTTYAASSGWGAAATVDDGTGNGAGWFSLAAHPAASATELYQYVVAYEGLDAGGAATSVKARIYSQNDSAFTAEQSLGTTLTSLVDARPTAYVTRDSKVGVVFVGTPANRRVYVSTYR